MANKVHTLTESEIRKLVTNIVNEALNEIDYRGAALAQGANYNASIDNKNNNVNAKQKMASSEAMILSAINQAIHDNFPTLLLTFIETKKDTHTSYPIDFAFQELRSITNKRFVMYGTINIAYREKIRGCIEYQFKSGKFYRVNFYGNGTIRRINPLEIDWETKNEVYRFLTFMSNYLYATEDYENNVNVNGSTPSKKH